MNAEPYVYTSPNAFNLIYVYAIPGSSDHAGLLKVGGATLKTTLPHSEFPPNCAMLNDAANARIRQQTNTAGVKYNLLHTEIAVRWTGAGSSRYLSWFLDHHVHSVLENSGFRHVRMPGTKAKEWYKVDLATVKRAIKAVKEGRVALDSDELASPAPFRFREEQERAIQQTLSRFKKHTDMLWDAKMRFGKTPTALEVVRRGAFRKTIIITHRPVVATSWKDDFNKIFPKDSIPYEFIDKFSAGGVSNAVDEAAKKRMLESHDRNGRHFIYFASIQDLRGSKKLGGSFLKNEAVFDLSWDLVIVDEAHEGTQTELGKRVSDALSTKDHTRVLSLSGTPFNILESYKDDDAVFVWDYTQEQKTKLEWKTRHPGEPNPYAVLPKMNILTFNLAKVMRQYAEEELEGKAFNFTEFFRTWTGEREVDGRGMPPGVRAGDFVHAADVRKFLDLISTSSEENNYPFSTTTYCDCFRHSLWMVPGVAAAKALSAMLQRHPIFGSFGVANVAGAGDDYEEEHYDSALELVRETIRTYPRSITLSCGKLTTGVTVPEWTAVLMLAGSVHTSASSYMQTIFRVQSPWMHDGQVKEECYVFDFAPDRALTVLTETAQLSKRVKKSEAQEEKGRAALREFLNFCPVLAMEGGCAKPYDTQEMMRRLKHVFVMKAIRNGFDDPSIYNNDKLMKLGRIDLMKFDGLMGIVGKSKQTQSLNSVDLAQNGFDEEEWERRKGDEERRKGRKLSPEEEAARKQHLEELKHARDARNILRAISIRMPLLIYGADVPFDETISIKRFVAMVDDVSWAEFMPKGVTKAVFRRFVEYYDPDVFEQAGIEIRKLVKSAEKLPPGRRVAQIARIFSYFKNPDKETVLTPWRVVNLHLGDTLGGWCFFGEDFDEKMMPDEPRHVDRGEATKRAFAVDAKVLEINSKSGLYPLYVAYSIYRSRCGEIAEDDIAEVARAKKWREVLCDNVYVVCKTPMAVSIKRRTLAGYTTAEVNASCWNGDLVETLKSNPMKFAKAVTQGKFWGKEDERMEFDAIVGNPPYQLEVAKKQSETNGQAPRKSIFHYFQMAADGISSGYVSLIYPGIRWIHRSGKDMAEFGLAQINDPHLTRLDFYPNSQDVFTSVAIADGISIVCKDMHKTAPGFVYVYHKDGEAIKTKMANPGTELVSLNPKDDSITRKVRAFMKAHALTSLFERVMPRSLFGIESDFVEKNPRKVKPYNDKMPLSKDEIKLFTNDRAGKAGRAQWYVAKRSVIIPENRKYIDEWQVIVSSANAGGQKRDWQLVICDNHSAFGRARVGLSSFKTKVEAEHFYAYCKTYLIRFLFLMTDESLTSLAKAVPDFRDYSSGNGMLDFSGDLNAQLYALMGLTKSEQLHVEKTVKDLDASRNRR